MHGRRTRGVTVTSLLFTIVMLALSPAQALAQAIARFVHAVPGAGAASLELTEGATTVNLGRASFGQSTRYKRVRTGRLAWKLIGGGKVLASGNTTIGAGAWTIVALAKGSGVAMGVYRDRAGVPGASLLRVIHAAPELGSPNLKLDSRVVASGVKFAQGTPYVRLSPGVHELAAMKAGDAMPLISGHVTLATDTATTAIVIGSRGQRTRVVTFADRGAPPARSARAGTRHARSTGHARATRHAGSTGGIVTVQRGDSLWSIARAHLGGDPSNARIAAEVRRLWDLNARRIGTSDPNLIFPGQRLRMS